MLRILVENLGMKVRIEDQRIVFRLSDVERDILKDVGIIGVETSFGEDRLKYQLLLNEDVKTIGYSFNNGIFSLVFPLIYLERWEDEKIGFEEEINGLKLIVEKDLKRSKKRD